MVNTVLFILLLLLVAIVLVSSLRDGGLVRFADYSAKPLLTLSEKQFFRVLVTAFPSHHVLAKVSLGALLQSRNTGAAEARVRSWGLWNAVSSHRIDFCLLDDGLEVVALIELDDSPQRSTAVLEKDRILEQWTSEAGFVTVRFGWVPGALPSAWQVRDKVLASIKPSEDHKLDVTDEPELL
jgi:hypothetical protein